MDVKFKCQECRRTFSQRMEDLRQVGPNKWNPKGLMSDECPFCGHNYMDCLNLDEAIAHVGRLDRNG
jgi:hypothetical protein